MKGRRSVPNSRVHCQGSVCSARERWRWRGPYRGDHSPPLTTQHCDGEDSTWLTISPNCHRHSLIFPNRFVTAAVQPPALTVDLLNSKCQPHHPVYILPRYSRGATQLWQNNNQHCRWYIGSSGKAEPIFQDGRGIAAFGYVTSFPPANSQKSDICHF